ncbi:hypothetical protein ACJW30_09G174000 [Castanea mollissima]
MSKSGALDLASRVGGKLQKEQVLSTVQIYEKYHVHHGGDEEERKANYTDMGRKLSLFAAVVNKYYDLVTSFYEYGWGESFHFAARWKGESLRESIKRHEHFVALQLGLKPGQKVLDVGCGIGGPLREIARFSGASITGINNNEYQITRGKELNRIANVDEACNYVKVDCYDEIYRVLKPGQCFAAYEWCITDSFDPLNQEHQRIKGEVELPNGLPGIRSMGQCLEALKVAGFEIIWEEDVAVNSPLPWYLPLDKNHIRRKTKRRTCQCASEGTGDTEEVKTLEFLGLAPEGSQRVQSFLKGIFSPMYFFLVQKPHS